MVERQNRVVKKSVLMHEDCIGERGPLGESITRTPRELCDVHYRVGIVHSQQAKELSVALEDFTKASKCAPKRADVWTELAGVYRKLGDEAAVMKHYVPALKQTQDISAIIGTAVSI